MKISIKTLLITASIVLIILIGGIFFFYQTQTPNTLSPENGGVFGKLFPFITNNNTQSNGGVNDSTDQISNRLVPALRQITDNTVSGAFIYLNENNKPTIRYVEKESGNIYEISADSYNSTRITNTTIPGIYETVWIDENSVVLRYFSDGEIETFYAKLKPQATEQSLNGSFVSSWDKTSFDKISKNFFSSFEGVSGSTLTFGKIGGTSKSILVSPIKSWVPLQTEKGFFVQTAPSSSVYGSLFEIKSNNIVEVIKNIKGFVTNIQPKGEYLFATSELKDSFVYNLNKAIRIDLPFKTIASKCTWVSYKLYCGVSSSKPNGNYPEDWYLGRSFFDDRIWSFDVIEEKPTLISDPSREVNQQIDVWQPMVDETESYMIFINKRDLTLWSLRLKEPISDTTDPSE